MSPFITRSIIENLREWLGGLSRQADQYRFANRGFDLTPFPIVKPKTYGLIRDIDNCNMVVDHISAVDGGFGTTERVRKKWRNMLLGRSLPEGIQTLLCEAGLLGTNGLLLVPSNVDALAERLALWERFHASVAYHRIALRNGDYLKNRDFLDKTWHAGLGNDGIGFAMDCGPNEILTARHVETGVYALTDTCTELYERSARAQLHGVVLVPHRAFSRGRRRDTNPEVHRKVVMVVTAKLDFVSIGYDIKLGSGREIPNTWDPNSPYDKKGRHVGSIS